MARPIAIAREEKPVLFSAEKVAYWFFRLNGCLFLENFLVHNENWKKGNGTEIDLLSVRFPYRQELKLSGTEMPDHEVFGKDKMEIIFAEVKSKQPCSINDSWLNPEGKNMERMLYIIGAIQPGEIDGAAKDLYTNKTYEAKTCRIRLFAIGADRDSDLEKGIIQLDWSNVLMFVHDRFVKYTRYKTEHEKWDDTGKNLYTMAIRLHNKPNEFAKNVIRKFIN